MLQILFGLLAGICTSLGFGGGSILILLLTNFMNLDLNVAKATNLLCFIPSALISIIINSKHNLINYKSSFIIILFGLLGVISGFLISKKIPFDILKKIFGSFLLFVSFYEIYSYYKLYIKGKTKT